MNTHMSNPANITSKKILMVVYSDYPGDVRVRREAEALIDAGHNVDILCLRKGNQLAFETIRNVDIYRINLEHKRAGKIRYLWNYAYFFMRVMLKATSLHHRNRYHIIHTHNMPEFLVFAQIIPRLRGAKLVVDLHDPMPEVFMSKFQKPASHWLIRFLRILERWSLGFVDAIITTNISFLELFVSRSCPRDKIRLVMNSPQESVFGAVEHRGRREPDNKFIIMYHGTITERYGLDTAVEALVLVRKAIPTAELHVYNDGEFLETVKKQVEDLKLQNCVSFHGRVTLEQIAEIIPSIDVGVVPNHRDAFTEINLPTRILEYICMNRSAVAPRTTGVLDYFNDETVHLFEPDDAADLARVLIDIYKDKEKRDKILQGGIEVYQKYTWAKQKENLLELVAELTGSTK